MKKIALFVTGLLMVVCASGQSSPPCNQKPKKVAGKPFNIIATFSTPFTTENGVHGTENYVLGTSKEQHDPHTYLYVQDIMPNTDESWLKFDLKTLDGDNQIYPGHIKFTRTVGTGSGLRGSRSKKATLFYLCDYDDNLRYTFK